MTASRWTTEGRRRAARPGGRDYDFCRCGQVKRAKSGTCIRCRPHAPNSGSFQRGGPRPGGSPRSPIGAERIDLRTGEVLVKVSHENPWRTDTNSGLWVARRVLNWVGAHGPVPDGLIVKRLSADLLDDSPENLVLVSRRVLALLNTGNWTTPRQPWPTLPPDRATRLAAVSAAVAVTLAREKEERGAA